MKFHDYRPYFDEIKDTSLDQWLAIGNELKSRDDAFSASLYYTEHSWITDKRPYYSVYPDFVEPLSKIDLDINCEMIRLPLRVFLIRFAVGHEPISTKGKARSLLVNECVMKSGERGLRLSVDFGDKGEFEGGQISDFDVRIIELEHGKTVEQKLRESDGIDLDAKLRRLNDNTLADPTDFEPLFRLVCTLCLIGDNPEIITPDVLAKDKEKYEASPSSSIVDKAHRRGKVGWLVGSETEQETSPHYRRPHFGIRWTGQGRKIPQVVPIKGSIVKRKKISEVPHGYLDQES